MVRGFFDILCPLRVFSPIHLLPLKPSHSCPSSLVHNLTAMDDTPAYDLPTDEQGPLEPLQAPFNVALAPENLAAEDAPGQESALASALRAPDGERDIGEQFFDERAKPIQLRRLQACYDEGRNANAIATLAGRKEIVFDNGPYTTPVNDTDLSWSMDKTYLDLMICVGRGLGLGALLPNLQVHHNYEFKLDLTKPTRLFTAKYAKLGFDPTRAMLWIGRSAASEDVWLCFVQSNNDNDDDDDEEDLDPETIKGPTAMGTHRFRHVVMFLAKMLWYIGYMDITVDDDYPDVSDDADFQFATNIM